MQMLDTRGQMASWKVILTDTENGHLTSGICGLPSARLRFDMTSIKQFENLNTSYVNLAALLRYLRGQDFSGSIHVALDQYEAEIFLEGQGAEAVFEFDRASGTTAQNQGAMERVLVHSREPGGTITVYEGKSTPGNTHTTVSSIPTSADQVGVTMELPAQPVEWDELSRLSGVVIAAVERAVAGIGADFAANFHAACIAVGDDYPFLDPTASTFSYANGIVVLGQWPGKSVYVAGISECLGQVVSKLAIDKEEERFRESVAIEFAGAARLRPNGLAEFTSYLERIAGVGQ